MGGPALLVGVLILISPGLSAQAADNRIDAPFVSHLSAERNGREVVLSWRDAAGPDDVLYEIRRSKEQILADTVDRSRTVAVVAPGIEGFTDRPDPTSAWWYAVLTLVDGEPEGILIPYRNTLGAAVDAVAGVADLSRTARVLTLAAARDAGAVRLDWTADRADRDIVVFRSSEPLDDVAALDLAVIAGRGAGNAGRLVDEPLPGVIWYYAAVDAALFERADDRWVERAAFSPPIALIAPGSVDGEGPQMRPAPLPRLRITRSFTDGRRIPDIDGELPDRRPLTNDAIRALAAILDPIQGRIWTAPEPEILDVDTARSVERRQAILQGILDDSFAREDWELAEAELFALSAANGLDEAMRARIQFYRGQCLYFLDDLSESFLSFLVASEFYYPEARRWMLRIYDDLTPVE